MWGGLLTELILGVYFNQAFYIEWESAFIALILSEVRCQCNYPPSLLELQKMKYSFTGKHIMAKLY
jgi:hypothetical protein